MNTIELWNINNDKALELASIYFPKRNIEKISFKNNGKIIREFLSCDGYNPMLDMPISDELLKEIIDSEFEFTINLKDNKIVIALYKNNSKLPIQIFDADTIYECLIKAVVWIRNQKC